MIGNVTAWLLIGILMGWLVSQLLRAGTREMLFLNFVVGGAGALLAGCLLAPMIAAPSSLATVAVASLGAAGLLLIVAALSLLIRMLVRRGRLS